MASELQQVADSPDDLSDLRQRTPLFGFRVFLASAGPGYYAGAALMTNFIRVVDIAVRRYQSARDFLQRYATSPNDWFGAMAAAAADFESCLDSINRSIKFMKALRADAQLPDHLKTLLPRTSCLLRGDVESEIVAIRNAIQHLEDDIIKGDLKEGSPFVLMPTNEGLTLGNRTISFTGLAAWIRELHSMASALAQA